MFCLVSNVQNEQSSAEQKFVEHAKDSWKTTGNLLSETANGTWNCKSTSDGRSFNNTANLVSAKDGKLVQFWHEHNNLESVFGSNGSYRFRLERATDGKTWLLKDLEIKPSYLVDDFNTSDLKESILERIITLNSFKFSNGYNPWLNGNQTWLELDDLNIKKTSPIIVDGEELVQIELSYSHQFTSTTTANVRLVVDPDHYWAIREVEFDALIERPNGSYHHKYRIDAEYDYSKNGIPVPKKFVRVEKVNNVVKLKTECAYEIEIGRQGLDSTIRLPYFGIPEPIVAPKKWNVPFALVITGIGLTLFGAALFFRTRAAKNQQG